MANNPIKLEVIGTLNTGSSIGEINTALRGIQKKINSLKLNIQIDDKASATIANFSKQLTNLASLAQKNSKVIEESIMPDGSKVKRTYFDGVKNEFSQIVSESKKVKSGIDNTTTTLNNQKKTIKDLTTEYTKLANESKKYDAQGKLKSTVSTYQNDKGNSRVITSNADGTVIGHKDIENLSKFQTMQANLREQLKTLAQTGNYTSKELSKIGKSINLSSTIAELNQVKSSMNGMKFNSSIIADQNRIKTSLKSLFDQAKLTEAQFNGFGKSINSAKSVAEVNKISNAMNKLADKNVNKAMQDKLLSQSNSLLNGASKGINTQEVSGLITKLNSIKPGATNAANALKQIENQLRSIRSAAAESTAATSGLGASLMSVASRMSMYVGIGAALYAPINALKDMTSRILEIDVLMTNLKRVMNEPDYKFVEMLDTSINTIDSLSGKLVNYLEILGEFGRMGYGEDQLNTLAESAQVLTNISDLTATDSVKSLVSAMMNYNIAAEDSIKIADKLNEVD